jgi:hypothetical protein
VTAHLTTPITGPGVDIIGVDCATDPRKTGLAHLTLTRRPDAPPARPVLRYLERGTSSPPVAETLAGLLTPGHALVVALDAPLGWPAPMGEVLAGHRAGERVGVTANRLFRRHTDRVVRETIGKQPLDVGADRIARTAVAALQLLADMRRLTGRELPVATRGAHLAAAAADGGSRGLALEVYPAGRLIALHGEDYRRGYRGSGSEAQSRRRGMLADLGSEADVGVGYEKAITDVDLLDALLCALAAVDVLHGRCAPPEMHEVSLEEVDREGWIWLPGR